MRVRGDLDMPPRPFDRHATRAADDGGAGGALGAIHGRCHEECRVVHLGADRARNGAVTEFSYQRSQPRLGRWRGVGGVEILGHQQPNRRRPYGPGYGRVDPEARLLGPCYSGISPELAVIGGLVGPDDGVEHDVRLARGDFRDVRTEVGRLRGTVDGTDQDAAITLDACCRLGGCAARAAVLRWGTVTS